ncbi:MAG: polyhydroxybutyrate depolymerase, partial [Actinomycetota bacterium]|nr:polyhydroxybutyrate depolymerase [Actinomycetota bacterium]
IQTWARINGCEGPPAIEVLPKSAEDLEVRRAAYGPGIDGAEVVLYSIEGGGHTWPGRASRLFFLGETTKNFSANDVIWDFFLRHPMK